MRKKLFKNIFIVFICIALAAMNGACGFSATEKEKATPMPAVSASPVPVKTDDHSNVQFSDMSYVRPDTDAIRQAIENLKKNIEAGAAPAVLLTEYRDVLSSFNVAESAMSLAYLLYAFDVTEPYYEQEYAFLQSELNSIDLMMTDVSVQLFESSEEAEQLARDAFSDAYLETVYEQESLNSEEVQELQAQEVALVNEYNRASNDFSFSDNGVDYTLDDVLNITDIEEFSRLYDAYISALNATVGEIYLRMVDVRSEIAAKLGYGSYAAYMYDCYGRDYTLQDAKRLHEAVKTCIVPVYLAAYGVGTTQTYAPGNGESDKGGKIEEAIKAIKQVFAYYVKGNEDAEIGALELDDATYPMDAYLETLQQCASDFSPKLYASLRHMLQNGLYDFSVNPKKMAGSFTTYISEYDAPFIFSQWENSSLSVATVIHELGHYTNYYRNPSVGWSSGDSLDLAEVDSQGLELLMIPYYDRFYGELAPYAKRELLVNCMYSLISGCMEDELQQAVYANPDMTLDEINAVYDRLSDEYGFSALYSYSGKEWVEIPHTFQSPMYYISYAVSMVPALELWRLAQTDMDGAKETYFSIMDREKYAAFRDVISENELSDVFATNTIRDIADMISEQVH